MLRFAPAVAFALLSVTAHAQDAVFPPGSRIGLVPPVGMKPSRGMAGFQNPETGSALALVEMPADAYPNLAAGFSEEALRAQGFTLKTRETVKVGGTDGLLVTGEQHQGARIVPKVVLLAPQPTMTVLVIGQAPDEAPSDHTATILAELRTALTTVALRPPLSMDEQLAALPFRIGTLAGFHPVRVMAGNAVMLTLGSSDTVREAEQPTMIVAVSLTPPPPVEQRDAFAKAMLVSNTLIRDTVPERSQSFRQNGADWHEIVAKAIDGPSGRPVIISQTIRFERSGYLRTVGIARSEQRDDALPRFRQVVDSLTLQ